MHILESLWYGNCCPCDQMPCGSSDEVTKWEETLQANLSPAQWKLFLQYEAAQNHRAADQEEQVFAFGVRFGIQLLLECLQF